MSDSTPLPDPAHWPATYPGALSALGTLLADPTRALPSLSVAPGYGELSPVAQLLLPYGPDPLARVLSWARVMDEVRSVLLVPYERDIHVRVTGVLAGPLVMVTAIVPGGLPVDVDGVREVSLDDLAVLAGETSAVPAEAMEVSA